jgi:hypothetical protein
MRAAGRACLPPLATLPPTAAVAATLRAARGEHTPKGKPTMAVPPQVVVVVVVVAAAAAALPLSLLLCWARLKVLITFYTFPTRNVFRTIAG